MKMLSREEILSAKLRIVPVETPEWGEDTGVFVREFSAADREEFLREAYEDGEPDDKGNPTRKGRDKFYERILLICVCDSSGKRILKPNDIEKLAEVSPIPIERIAVAALKLSGIKSGAVEQAEKNSELTMSEDSSSA